MGGPILPPGFWPTDYWPDGYWEPSYWGIEPPGEQPSGVVLVTTRELRPLRFEDDEIFIVLMKP